MELVGKGNVSPNGLPALGARLVCRIPGLHHEAFDIPVKLGAIVGSTGAESEKVKGGARGRIAKDFQLQVAECGVESHRHFILLHVVTLRR